jgi:hypothetical protein
VRFLGGQLCCGGRWGSGSCEHKRKHLSVVILPDYLVRERAAIWWSEPHARAFRLYVYGRVLLQSRKGLLIDVGGHLPGAPDKIAAPVGGAPRGERGIMIGEVQQRLCDPPLHSWGIEWNMRIKGNLLNEANDLKAFGAIEWPLGELVAAVIEVQWIGEMVFECGRQKAAQGIALAWRELAKEK